MRDIEKCGGGKLHHRQKIICDFFIEVLGIDHTAAEEGASKMEHAVSVDITERMAQYARFLKGKKHQQKFDRESSR